MNDIRDQLDSLKQTLSEASMSFDIWWEIKNRETGPKYQEEIKRYSMFFQSTIYAHFLTAVISLYRLFEKNNKTINIPRLLSLLENEKKLSPQTSIDILKLQREIDKNWKKICIVRSNVFGHRSAKLNPQESYDKAGLQPDTFIELIDHTKKVLHHIYLDLFEEDHVFNLDAKKSTKALLHDLSKVP